MSDTLLKPSPDCPVCNHHESTPGPSSTSNTPRDSRSSLRRQTKFREQLSIITTNLPEPVEKSAFSPDTPSSEYFREAQESEQQHDDPPTPATIVGELPEVEAQEMNIPPKTGTVRSHKPIIVTQKATPWVPPLEPLPRSTTPPFVQTIPYYRNDHDVERALPPSPRTTRTVAPSSRSVFSRILAPFWTSRHDELQKEMAMDRSYSSHHRYDLPRHAPSPPLIAEPKLEPKFRPWNPLRIKKKPQLKPLLIVNHQEEEARKKRKQRKKERRRWLLILLIIILLFLLGDAVFLNIRVSQLNNTALGSGLVPTTSTGGSSPGSPTNPNQLSPDAQTCLSQFQLNAPSSPGSYSCSTCLPILQGVPSSFFKAPTTNSATSQNITNAVQFCSLKAVFDSAGQQGGSNPLGNAGWLQNLAFCTWAGVTCGGDGRVTQLELDSPAVPTTFPNELGALSGLQSLKVTGNNQVPAGTLPAALGNLTSLQAIQIQNTGLTGSLPDVFSTLKQLKSLSLSSNVHMQLTLPSSLSSIPLQALIINSQPLGTPLSFFTSIASSSPLLTSLQLLSFTNTSLSGPIPDLATNLPNLAELHLGSNIFSLPLPGNFPPKLTVVDLSGNPGLAGASVPQQFCNSAQVKSCSLQGSGMVNPCGVCSV